MRAGFTAANQIDKSTNFVLVGNFHRLNLITNIGFNTYGKLLKIKEEVYGENIGFWRIKRK